MVRYRNYFFQIPRRCFIKTFWAKARWYGFNRAFDYARSHCLYEPSARLYRRLKSQYNKRVG